MRRSSALFPSLVLFILGGWVTALPTSLAAQPSELPFRLGFWIQPAWEIQDWEEERTRDGAFLRRARLDFTATFLDGLARIRVMPELARTTELRDAWVEVIPAPGWGIRMGQQTVPFHLQRITHAGRQHFGERSLATRRFELASGRDVGAVVGWSGPERDRNVQVGLFNGEGPNRRELGPGSPLMTLRGGWAFGGSLPSGESDLARSPSPVLAVGGGVMAARESTLRVRPGFVADLTSDWEAGTVDADFRWEGISLTGAWYSHRVRPIDDDRPDVDGSGWHLSGGWVPPSRKLEVTLRRSEAAWDRSDRGNRETETGVGLTLFHREHALQSRIQLFRWGLVQGGELRRGNGLVVEHQLLIGG